MDSTFLGMLAGFEVSNGKPALPPFGLYQPSRKILDSLADLDLEHCFREIDELSPTEGGFRDVPLQHAGENHANLALHSLQAHRQLMSLSPSNASRFRKVEEFLSRGTGPESASAPKKKATRKPGKTDKPGGPALPRKRPSSGKHTSKGRSRKKRPESGGNRSSPST